MRIKKHRRSIYLSQHDEELLLQLYLDSFKSSNRKTISDIVAQGIRILAAEERLDCLIEVK